MNAVALCLVLAALIAAVVVWTAKPWRKPTAVLTVTLSADATAFVEAMRGAMKLMPTAEEASRALRPWTDPE